MVLLHGIGTNRYLMSKSAPLFWERGCDLLMFDARYHGESTGAYGTYGYYEKLHSSKAIDWFSQQVGLPPERIGLLGKSYGAATALETARCAPTSPLRPRTCPIGILKPSSPNKASSDSVRPWA